MAKSGTDQLLLNCRIAPQDAELSLIDNGAIAIHNGLIAWLGNSNDVPAEYRQFESTDLKGRLVTPALIDCHTHLVFGGNRAKEFEMRLEGASYEEVARAGGGIVSTVTATREASRQQLLASALNRLDTLIAEGVATLEVKSGYGLDIETELNMLRVARELSQHRDVQVVTSYLGAHALPAEYKDKPDAFIEEICIPALHRAVEENLVDAVDGFCEGIAFTPEQIARVFDVAKSLNLPVKLHAEQLSHLGGTALAARYGALSADHLEYATEQDAIAMASSGTVAVILPGAFYTIKETQQPPINAFRKHNVPMAIATDCNPGSSPLTSLLLAMNMSCTLFSMTPAEVLAGVTRNAAKALGLTDRGVIAAGLRADLAVWDVEQIAELSYRMGFNPVQMRIFAGQMQ